MFDVSIVKFPLLRKLVFFMHQGISAITSPLGEKENVNRMDIRRII